MTAKIISDVPNNSDELESHNSIANALLQLIKNSSGGKTIGLEGTWGSGKTTIIKILEERIDSDEHIHLHKFDAWTHQGEPLRRAFLEGLFDKTLGTAWFQAGLQGEHEKSKWNEARENLSKKIKINSKIVLPHVNFFGKILIFLFLLLPLGMAIIGSTISAKPAEQFAWKWYVGGGILVLPALALATMLLITFIANFKNPDRQEKIQNVWAIFLQKSHSSDVTRTIENTDRTTIEFQNEFKNFMQDALSAPKKKLILVVDNLDRISEKEVENIWPILRSFVDNPEFLAETWFSQFWVIIPYAPNTLKPALSASGEKSTEKMDNLSKQIGFLDKVIQINFPVPAPTLSSLKKFIREKLFEAFGSEIKGKCIQNIFLLISSEFNQDSEVTPRIVIGLINNMVATFIQWPTIDIVSHAFFAILRRKYPSQEIAKLLVSESVVSKKYKSILSEKIAVHLAVLIYNVPESIAVQKMYGEEIDGALTNDDGGAKLRIDYNKIGYPDVLSIVLAKFLETSPDEINLLSRKICNLIDAGLLSNSSSEHKDHLKNDIREAIQHSQIISFGTPDTPKFIEALIREHGDFFGQAIEDAMSRTKLELERNHSLWYQLSDSNPAIIVNNIQRIRKNLVIRKFFTYRFPLAKIIIPGPFDQWIKLCEAIESDKEASIKGFLPPVSFTEILRNFIGINHYQNPVSPMIAAYNSLFANDIKIPDDIFIKAFVLRINRRAEFPINEIALTLPLVIKIAKSNENVEKSMLALDPIWALHYIGAIFGGDIISRNNEDMPGLSIEESRGKLFSSLIFLWLISGVKMGPSKADDSILIGNSILQTFLLNFAHEKEILGRLRSLFNSKKWRSVVEENMASAEANQIAFPLIHHILRDN